MTSMPIGLRKHLDRIRRGSNLIFCLAALLCAASPASKRSCATTIKAQANTPAIRVAPNVDEALSKKIGEFLLTRPFIIPAELVREIQAKLEISDEDLLINLLPLYEPFARPEISQFRVAVTALTEDGKVFVGVNLEFGGLSKHYTIHGEQFLFSQLFHHHQGTPRMMALRYHCCGHCRQWMNDIKNVRKMPILVAGNEVTNLERLLPNAFGARDLGIDAELLTHPPAQTWRNVSVPIEGVLNVPDLFALASTLGAATNSFVPQGYSPEAKVLGCGVTVETTQASYCGSLIENAAFNPEVSPISAALIGVVAAGEDYDAIHKITHVEPETRADRSAHLHFTRGIVEYLNRLRAEWGGHPVELVVYRPTTP